MGFFKGLVGAGVGFLTGGPAGAAIGGLSGFASGGGDQTTQNSSFANRGTRQTTARNLTPAERAQQQQSQAGLLQSTAGMSNEEAAKLREERFAQLFGTASGEINRAANTAQQSGYAANARRGLGGSTNSDTQRLAREGVRQNSLSRASTESALGADELVQNERANRRANAAVHMATLNDIWNRVLSTSKITTTSKGTGQATEIGPDTFLQSAAAGAGSALTNANSYYNKQAPGGFGDFLGGI